MTSVIIRRVKTNLEAKTRLPGGMKVSESIAKAESNLVDLSDVAQQLVDDGILRLTELVDPESQRPSPAALDEINQLADALLGYCSALARPGLDQCLQSLGYLVQAVAVSELWRPGTFGPSLAMIKLTARSSLAPAQTKVLLDAVAKCIAHYQPAFTTDDIAEKALNPAESH